MAAQDCAVADKCNEQDYGTLAVVVVVVVVELGPVAVVVAAVERTNVALAGKYLCCCPAPHPACNHRQRKKHVRGYSWTRKSKS